MRVKCAVRWGLWMLAVMAAASLAGCASSVGTVSLRSDNPLLRRAAVQRISSSGDISGYEDLVAVIREDPDRLVRSQAAFGLGTFGKQYFGIGFHPLADSLENDPSPFVRSAAALSLSSVRDCHAIAPLVAALRDASRGEMAVRHGARVVVYRACVADAARTSLEKIIGLDFRSTATSPEGKRMEIASQWEAWYMPRRHMLPGETAIAVK